MVFKSFRRNGRFGRRRGSFRTRRFRRPRRGFKGSQRNFATTALHGPIRSLGFKGRKMGIRKWRSGIYRDTLYKPHYRSIISKVNTQSTGTTPAAGTLNFNYPEVGSTLQTPFWTASGGAVAIDQSVSLPNFIGDITIRGGTIGIGFDVLDAVTDVIGVRVWLCFGKQGHTIPSSNTLFSGVSRPWGADPSIAGDLTTVGGVKVLKNWTAYLKYNQPMFWVEHRIKPRKVDQQPYITANADAEGAQFLWIYHVVNLSSATSQTVGVTTTHNLSFSGDADTVV